MGGEAWRDDQVDKPVALKMDSPMPRYPSVLRGLSLTGSARFRFVVDTLGHVEMSTVEQLQSSHEAFAVSVRAVLPRMRFFPARVGSRVVRQLVELPFVFQVTP
jgi:TonB family protein